ncbi:hypothetical protein [Globicatella sanguinis]
MSSFNFSPVLSKIGFYNHINTIPDNEVTNVVDIDSLDKLLVYFKLSGLNYMYPPKEYSGVSGEIDFYINIAIINQRGGRTSYYHNTSKRINKESIMITDNSVELLSTVFDKNDEKYNFSLNMVDTFLMCIIFFSEQEVKNDEELITYLKSPYHVLFSSKIPVVGGFVNGR